MMWNWNDGTDYLAHHGIKGQKWGIQNGPPYPLDESVHDAVSRSNGNVYIFRPSVKTESDYERAFYSITNNSSKRKEVAKAISDKLIKEKASQLDKAYSVMNELYNKLQDQYNEKNNGEWSGDGTELHYYFIENSDSYKKIVNDYEKRAIEYIKECKRASANGAFDKIKVLKNIPNFVEVYKENKWAKVADTRAAIVAECLTKDSMIWPQFFFESRNWDKKNGVGNKRFDDESRYIF